MTESDTFFTPVSSPQVDVPVAQMLDNSSALNQLLDADQEKLLDLIDNLRHSSISEYVELPQVIVCGDQSCGKSSVLEGISGQSFPRGEGLCTTFATELVLRRAEPQIKVKIVPADTKTSMKDWKEMTYDASENLEKLINSAKSHLRSIHKVPEGSFFKDILRIEVSNPNWPPLTLVDLPGLIQSANKNQSKKDIGVVHNLVKTYMRKKKTIILAVLSAENYVANQKALDMAKEMDPRGERTMGIITKPDKLENGTMKEDDFLHYAKNGHAEYKFTLGWHVVRNRGHGEDGYSLEERNRKEEEFFADSIWKRELGNDKLGINALRIRLSKVLGQHIRAALPGIIDDIHCQLQKCEEEIKGFGGLRSTLSDQKTYLTKISDRFQALVRKAVRNDFIDDRFFSKSSMHSAERNLRSFIECSNRRFQHVMYNRGHKWAVSDTSQYFAWSVTTGTEKHGFHSFDAPQSILREEYVEMVENKLMERSNRQLPSTFDPRIVTPLVHEQCSRWRVISHAHIEYVFMAARRLLYDAITEACMGNENTANLLSKYLIDDILERKWAALELKLNEILSPYEKLQVATLNPNFGSSVSYKRKFVKSIQRELDQCGQNLNEDSTEYQLVERIRKFISTAENEPTEFASTASDILDIMHNYYEIALVSFIENVADLVVENSLMYDLENEFTHWTIHKMALKDQKLLTLLASETPDISQRRAELTNKKEELQKALETCLDATGPGTIPIVPRRAPNFPLHSDPSAVVSSQTTGDSLDEGHTSEAVINGSVSTPAHSSHSASSSLSTSTSPTVPSPGIESDGIDSLKGKSHQKSSSVSNASLVDGVNTAPSDSSASVLSLSAGNFEREQSPTPKSKVRVTSQP